MDETEFRRLLDLFPVVRRRDFCLFDTAAMAELELDSRQSTSCSTKNKEQVKEWQDAWDDRDKKQMENEGTNLHDAFWEKLKLAAGRKLGASEAEKFCQAFQQIHKKLVYEGLSLDTARSYINNSSKNLEE